MTQFLLYQKRFILISRTIDLLAPLTSAGDLPDHPSLATAYTSNVLSGMVQQACEMVHKEKKSLWDIKHLLTKFRGDQTWIPVESMISDESPLFSRAPLLEDPVAYLKPKVTNIDHFTADERKTERMPGQAATAVNVGREFGSRQRSNASLGELLPNVHNQRNLENTARLENPDVLMDDGSPHSTEKENPTQNTNGEKSRESHANAQENLQKNVTSTREEMADSNVINNNTKRSDLAASAIESRVLSNGTIPPAESDHEPKDTTATKVETEAGTSALKDLPVAEDNQIEETQPPAHRMRTRAQAQAVSEKTSSSHTRSPSPTSSVPPLIHPLYLVSSSSIPDRDFGLPPAEAEETRRILMSWVQKQEEICRGVEKLYDGLLKADRMRKTVLGWCKAEGHVGEMSDGEDWYDKEEWGLDEDLKKGHEEEEEDAGNQGKKTRGRRAVQ